MSNTDQGPNELNDGVIIVPLSQVGPIRLMHTTGRVGETCDMWVYLSLKVSQYGKKNKSPGKSI